MSDLRALFAAAWLQGLQDRPSIAPTDPATTVRLDTAGRPPVVPLDRPRGVCYSGNPRQWCRFNPNCRACHA